MNQHQSPQSESVDELLTLLSDRHCRATLSYLRDSTEAAMSVQYLANEIDEEDHGGTEEVVLQLQHSVLPRLAEIGVVDYDARSRILRYRGHPELETLLDGVTECYPMATEL